MHNYTEYYFEWIECWRIILLLVFVKAPLNLHAANHFAFSFPFSWCLWQPALSLSLTSSLSPEGNWRRCSHSPRKRWTSMPVSCFPPVSLSPYLLSSLPIFSLLSLFSPQVFLTWLSDITENLLYVLWRHLQFYLMHCKPVGGARGMGVGGASFTRPTMRRIDGSFTVLHHSDITF